MTRGDDPGLPARNASVDNSGADRGRGPGRTAGRAPGRHPASAQITFGALSSFDVFNDTCQDCHGFEIELRDISRSDVYYTFGTHNRYGDPKVVPFTDASGPGVYVRESRALPRWQLLLVALGGADGHQARLREAAKGVECKGALRSLPWADCRWGPLSGATHDEVREARE